MEIKKVDDYVDAVHERFPELDRALIKKIMNRGWRNFGRYNIIGGDYYFQTNYFKAYCGKVFSCSIRFMQYWFMKSRLKARFLYLERKTKYDGYMYFGLDTRTYEIFKNTSKRQNGLKRKLFEGHPVILYKSLDECKSNWRFCRIFRIKMDNPYKFSVYQESCRLKRDDMEEIYYKDADVITTTTQWLKRNQ